MPQSECQMLCFINTLIIFTFESTHSYQSFVVKINRTDCANINQSFVVKIIRTDCANINQSFVVEICKTDWKRKKKKNKNPYFIAKSCRNGCPKYIISCPKYIVSCPKYIIGCPKYIISCPKYIISHGLAPMPNCQTLAHDALPAMHKWGAGIVQWLQRWTCDQDHRFDPAGAAG